MALDLLLSKRLEIITDQMAEWYRASASGSVDWGLIPSRVKPMTLKLVYTASLLDVQHFKGQCGESRQVYLLCRWERHFTEFPHLIDRWSATAKRARTRH